MRLPRADILAQADIFELAREFGLETRSSGSSRQVAPCVFHQEAHASLTLYLDQHFHCFGCGAHGTVVDLTMHVRQCNFRMALTWLADRAGIVLRNHESDAPQPYYPTPRQKAATERDDVLDRLRLLRDRRAELNALATDSRVLPELVLDDLVEIASEEWDLIVRFDELTVVANGRVDA